MKRIIVASKNPVKIEVASQAFSSVFPEEQYEFIGVQSDSGVPDQPIDRETETGARNRLTFVKKQYPNADYWVSQEGGLYRDGDRLYNRAWIMAENKAGAEAKSSTGMFYLPKKVADNVKSGQELGTAIDEYYASTNSKQGIGGIGFITDGLIDRTSYYLQAAIIVLSELKHHEEY